MEHAVGIDKDKERKARPCFSYFNQTFFCCKMFFGILREGSRAVQCSKQYSSQFYYLITSGFMLKKLFEINHNNGISTVYDANYLSFRYGE